MRLKTIGRPRLTVERNDNVAGDWYPGTIAPLAGEKIGIAYTSGSYSFEKIPPSGNVDRVRRI
ncbi:hypothetical protein [Ensifer canadensis]